MSSFIHNIVILMISCQCTYGLWDSSIYNEQVDDGREYPHSFASSEQELSIGFESSEGQYYNSREAHVNILDIVNGTNATWYHYANSKENSHEEHLDPIGTIIEGNVFKSGSKDFPYPLREKTRDSDEFSNYDRDTLKIKLDISDYLEAISDRIVTINENIESQNTRVNYGQAESPVISVKHSYLVPFLNAGTLDFNSGESGEYLTGYVNTKSVNQENFSAESKEISSQEAVVVYSSDTRTVDNLGGTSAESSETAELWTFVTEIAGTRSADSNDRPRIRPGILQDIPSSEIDVPLCSGRKKGNKQKQCEKEQNLCRNTGDCRIARIWGTCCYTPSCGTYCKQNRSRCPHPNSIKKACDESNKMCNPLGDDCPSDTSCCQVLPCGYRCV